MGQVITLPRQARASKVDITDERRHAVITGLCALTFLLGFFIAGPDARASTPSATRRTVAPGSSLTCVAGLLVVWAITRVAYKRLALSRTAPRRR